jgi:hypothetical protein
MGQAVNVTDVTDASDASASAAAVYLSSEETHIYNLAPLLLLLQV